MKLRMNLGQIAMLAMVAALGAVPLAAQWDQCDASQMVDFSPGPYGTGYYDIADDFTLPVLDAAGNTGASFTYSSLFPGCENVVFFGYRRDSCYAVYTARAEPDVLLENSPRNVHYVFLSFDSDPARVQEDVGLVRQDFEAALSALPQAEQDYWRPRLHYVTTSALSLPGWLNTFVQNTFFSAHPYWGWGIDRLQRIRNIGSTQDPNAIIECVAGDPNSRTWFPRTSHLANEPRLWNFEWYREDTLAQETFDTVPVWNERFAGNIYATVDLPDPETMAGYDTLLFDLELICYDRDGDTTVTNLDCEWDYLIHAYICDRDDPNSCGTEIGRWITTYGRDGRWVVDASPMLAFLRDGGSRRFRFYSQNGYDIDFKILLGNRGKGTRPFSAQFLYGGGTFNLSYNPNHPPQRVSIPAYAEKTELAAYVTGHGFGDAANCAEFCNHEHEFSFNGNPPYFRDHPLPDAPDTAAYGCMMQIDQELNGTSGPGTVPNQFGTWVYGRAGWCPGLEVEPWVEDVSADVVPGEEALVEYRGLYRGQDYDPQPGSGGGFGARITMNSYLVHHIGMPEADCANGQDDDGDTLADCEDTGCLQAANCWSVDFDGDGASNDVDCDPLDGGVIAAPAPLERLRVRRDTSLGSASARVDWDDVAAAAGSATGYDLVRGRLDALTADGGFASAACTRGQPENFYEDSESLGSGGFYYFVRARNFCGRTDFGRSTGGVCN